MLPNNLHWESSVTVEGVTYSWSQLAHLSPSLPEKVALISTSQSEAWCAFAGAIRQTCDFLLVDEGRADDELVRRLTGAGFDVVRRGETLASATTEALVDPGRITVLSSGTTGTPKLIPHSLKSLATMSGLTDQPIRNWLVPYAVGTYAWYQLAMTGLSMAHQNLVAVDGSDVTGWIAAARSHDVTAISATPTFWRRALLTIDGEDLRSLELQQITLGGEPVDQSILDRLHELYPTARLSHIYASSEAGACMSVNDGKAGFPVKWLDNDARSGVGLAIRDGMLFVRSPFHAADMGDEFIATGDRVEVRDGRVIVLGRADSGFINVGGTKVDAAQVANVLMQHPSVVWARVKGRKAPVIGQMPVAEVVVDDTSLSPVDLVQWAGNELPEAAAPRIVRILDEIPTTSALKSEVS